MKQNPRKEQVVNKQDDYNTDQASEPGLKKKDKKSSQQSKLTFDDLKGKKVDGDPTLESDQPVEQVVNAAGN